MRGLHSFEKRQKMNNSIIKILKKPSLLFLTLGHRGFLDWMDDEAYLKKAFKIRMGKLLNLETPQTYSEKLQWLKLYDRKPVYTQMVDKYEAKKYAERIIGSEYIVPTLGVWDSFEEIDFTKLPNQFVLKCTHDSGGLVICKDKAKFDVKKAKRKISACLKHNFFGAQREWPYKDIKPRIIAEQYMEDDTTHDLRDYKFFGFDGEVKALFIATERESNEETKFDFFDADYNHLPFTNGHPNAETMPEKPSQFELMKKLASELSKGVPQLRVDLYEVNGRVYFGELTFFHWSGMTPFVPEQWDYTFGEWIKLPAAESKKSRM